MNPPPLTTPMRELLQRIRRAARRPLQSLTPDEAKLAYELSAEILDLPRAPLQRVENLVVATPDGSALKARLYADRRVAALPVLLYLHGGGFTVGGLGTHDSLCRQLALRSGGAVLALDYRLAPQHRFPTAVDDVWAGLQWLQAQASGLGLDPGRIAIGGDSAGGTLAAVAALQARDAGLPLALQLLVTPGTGADADTASHRLFAHGYLLEAPTITWFFDQYIDRAERSDWRFAPLLAPELEGVAPACVVLAECDPLVDEGLAYADRLRASGVPVQLELYRGVTHDFIKLGRSIPEALQAQQAAADALKEAWSC